jgi:hypothetical protein
MRTSILANLFALGLVACSGQGSSADGSKAELKQTSASSSEQRLAKIDACALLQASEIEAATGIPPAGGRPQATSGGPPMCTWPSTDGKAPQLVQLLVTGSSLKNYAEYVRTTKEAMGGEYPANHIREAQGPGLFAAWMDEMNMLQVFDGRHMVQLSTQSAPGQDPAVVASHLAKAALARLE